MYQHVYTCNSPKVQTLKPKSLPMFVASPPYCYVLQTQLLSCSWACKICIVFYHHGLTHSHYHWNDWSPPALPWVFLMHCPHLHLLNGVKVFCQHLDIVHHVSSSLNMQRWHETVIINHHSSCPTITQHMNLTRQPISQGSINPVVLQPRKLFVLVTKQWRSSKEASFWM